MCLPSEKRELFVKAIKQIFKIACISLFTFTLILGGFYLHYQTMTSPYFQISNFEIKGNYFLHQIELRRMAEEGVLGQNIFRANIQLVSDRLRDNPWIETVEIGRKIPDILQVKIKERTPFVKIEMIDGKIFLIDRKAFLIKKIESHEYQLLPTIQLNNDTYYEIGSSLRTEEIEKGIELIEKIFSLKNPGHVINFTSITMEQGGRFTLKTPSASIRLSKKRLRENLDKLKIALRIIQQEGLKVKSIDLTFADQIVLKLYEIT